jgi:hypothetical protein
LIHSARGNSLEEYSGQNEQHEEKKGTTRGTR